MQSKKPIGISTICFRVAANSAWLLLTPTSRQWLLHVLPPGATVGKHVESIMTSLNKPCGAADALSLRCCMRWLQRLAENFRHGEVGKYARALHETGYSVDDAKETKKKKCTLLLLQRRRFCVTRNVSFFDLHTFILFFRPPHMWLRPLFRKKK